MVLPLSLYAGDFDETLGVVRRSLLSSGLALSNPHHRCSEDCKSLCFLCQVPPVVGLCECVTSALALESRRELAESDAAVALSAADMRTVADLRQAGVAVAAASKRLVFRGLLPPSAALRPEDSCQLLPEAPTRGCGAEQLRLLWSRRHETPAARRRLDACVRLWLLAPPPGLMADIAGALRQAVDARGGCAHFLAAAEELAIRWNGPELAEADGLLQAAARAAQQAALLAPAASPAERPCPPASVFQ